MTGKPLLTLGSSLQKKLSLPTASKTVIVKSTKPTDQPPTPSQHQPQKTSLSKENYQVILQYLQTHYPQCFTSNCDTPLAIGIHKQLMAIPKRPFSRSQLSQMISTYVKSKAYRQGLVVDADRINLNGTIASKVQAIEVSFLKEKNDKKSQ